MGGSGARRVAYEGWACGNSRLGICPGIAVTVGIDQREGQYSIRLPVFHLRNLRF